MQRTVQTKTQYDTDFGSFNLWKDSQRPNKFMIQTLARSSSVKITHKSFYIAIAKFIGNFY